MKAVKNGKTSLLLPGIVRAVGGFAKGDVVQLMAGDGQEIGKGITRLSAMDIEEKPLPGGVIVVHVNDMALMEYPNDQKEVRSC